MPTSSFTSSALYAPLGGEGGGFREDEYPDCERAGEDSRAWAPPWRMLAAAAVAPARRRRVRPPRVRQRPGLRALSRGLRDGHEGHEAEDRGHTPRHPRNRYDELRDQGTILRAPRGPPAISDPLRSQPPLGATARLGRQPKSIRLSTRNATGTREEAHKALQVRAATRVARVEKWGRAASSSASRRRETRISANSPLARGTAPLSLAGAPTQSSRASQRVFRCSIWKNLSLGV